MKEYWFWSKLLARLIHVFQVPSLGALGCTTFATLHNCTHKCIGATDLIVSTSIYETDGKLSHYNQCIATIKPYSSLRLDCGLLLEKAGYDNSNNYLITFHMLPVSISSDSSYAALVDVDRDIVLGLSLSGENYLELRHKNGGVAGVLYQSLPFNSSPFFDSGSFILQSPKVYAAREHSSATILFYPLPNNSSGVADASIRLTLRSLDGCIIKKWTHSLPPNQVQIIPTGHYLTDYANLEKDRFSIACLEGFSSSAYLVPFSMIFERGFRSIALEHSLPPSYYLKGDQQKFRSWIMNNQSSLV